MCCWRRAEPLEKCAGGSGYRNNLTTAGEEYGGLKVGQARRLKDLEAENARLKRAVAELTLDKLILKEAAEGPEGQRQQNW